MLEINKIGQGPSMPLKAENVSFHGNHSEKTKEVANDVHQKLTDFYAGQGNKPTIKINVGFKDGDPILYVTAYDKGKSVIENAKELFMNNFSEASSLSVTGTKAEIILGKFE